MVSSETPKHLPQGYEVSTGSASDRVDYPQTPSMGKRFSPTLTTIEPVISTCSIRYAIPGRCAPGTDLIAPICLDFSGLIVHSTRRSLPFPLDYESTDPADETGRNRQRGVTVR